jgi:Na+/H+-translocating membrane pyrophosphatase
MVETVSGRNRSSAGARLVAAALFGVRSLSGLLAGILASGLPMAISAACSGGAWGA